LAEAVPAQIRVTSDIRDFADFWPRSGRLGSARCYAFQCADLLELQCESVVPARNAVPFFVAILGPAGQPLALLPLCIEQSRDLKRAIKHARVLKFLDGGLSDYNAPVLFPAVADWDARTVRRIWQGLRRILPAFDLAILEKMPDQVGDLPNPFRFLKRRPERKSGHAVKLSGTWASFATRLPRRRGLRRKFRRLRHAGELTFEVARTPEQYDIFLEALLRQKRRRDFELRGCDSLIGPGYPAYLRKARSHLYPSGPVCLFALKLNDTIIAALFGVVAGSRFIAQIPGFEGGEWRAYSAGHLLYGKIVEWCFTEGIQVFDLGAGDEEWKDEYCDVSMTLHKALIPASIRGAALLHWPRIAERIHKRRVISWREMELAESYCLAPAETSRALKHARRSLVLWPSPRRTREFLTVARSIRARRVGRSA
jgi:CelD/BcsL family acetyltransferase involved in cellulose biosynthesis